MWEGWRCSVVSGKALGRSISTFERASEHLRHPDDVMSQLLRMRAALDYIEPEIWREFEIPDDASLIVLHQTLQKLFGWANAHLWEFQRDGRIYGIPSRDDWGEPPLDARKVTIRDVLGTQKRELDYLYDFGDNWQLTIRVRERGELDESVEYPRCLDGERSGPPEDCGGVPGYDEIVDGLEAGDLDEDLENWVGPWRPDDFDADSVDLASLDALEERARSRAKMMGAKPVDETPDPSSVPETSNAPEPPMGEFPVQELERELAPPPDFDLSEIESLSDAIDQIQEMVLGSLGLSLEDLPVDEDAFRDELRAMLQEHLVEVASEETKVVDPDRDDLKTFPTSQALRDCLARLPVDQLDLVFETLGLEDRPSRRGEREARIAEHLETGETVGELLRERVDDEGLELLARLAVEPRDIPATVLLKEERLDPNSDWLEFRSQTPLGSLRRLGLVHVGLHRHDGHDRVFVGIPEPLDEAIAAWLEANGGELDRAGGGGEHE